MRGEYIKDVLKKNGYTLNDIADIMGETPQNLQSMLRATDIKTGVLERIASAINKSLYFFFETDKEKEQGKSNLFSENINIPTAAWEIIQAQSKSLSAKDTQMQELISMLKEQIQQSKKTAARQDEDVKCADVG